MTTECEFVLLCDSVMLKSNHLSPIIPLNTGSLLTSILVNSEDPDEMQHYAALHQGLHCWQGLKQPSGAEIHHNL